MISFDFLIYFLIFHDKYLKLSREACARASFKLSPLSYRKRSLLLRTFSR